MALLGIDEVGRGPLAGPLVIGAVILPPAEEWHKYEWIGELRDSKKLSAKKREKLSAVILAEASATGLGWVPASEIDEVGISEALRLAARRAVEEVRARKVPFSEILIDGKVNFLKDTALGKYVTTKIKADDLVKEVSAASIIAKVARDAYMVDVAEKFPGYGFEKHVGYGTSAHLAALRKLGPCAEHRLSFEPCRSMTEFENDGVSAAKKNTTEIGGKAETVVAEYLKARGQMIVERNFKTKMCEIDIVSASFELNKIYFTEVKYRRDSTHGGGLAAVTRDKLKQMEFAAEVFLKKHPEFLSFDPLLTVAAVSGDDFSVDDWFTLT